MYDKTYCSLSSQDVQGKKKCHLPVFWRSGRNVWVRKQLLRDCFNSGFVHEVECYLKSKNLAFKVLLALDSAPGHPWGLDVVHPNIQIEYSPNTTISLLQPLNQGISMTLKSCYSNCTFCSILDASEKETLLVLVNAGNFTAKLTE
jgi:hypothetical protein